LTEVIIRGSSAVEAKLDAFFFINETEGSLQGLVNSISHVEVKVVRMFSGAVKLLLNFLSLSVAVI
jgi:hypothetical protein